MTHDQTRRGKNSPFGFGKFFVVIVSCNLAYLTFSFRCITLLFLVWDKQPSPRPPFPTTIKKFGLEIALKRYILVVISLVPF